MSSNGALAPNPRRLRDPRCAVARARPAADWARAGERRAAPPARVGAAVGLRLHAAHRRRAGRRAAPDRPRAAAGGRRGRVGPPAAGHVEPGSAIGVELVRGDMSTVATGTVTYVNGSDVLAFGHPMFGIGEVYLPMVDAEIHAFLPSLSQSFKMSSPLQRGRHAGAGSPGLHHRRPRRAHHDDAHRRARHRPRRRAAHLPRRGRAQPAADADAGLDGGRQRDRRRRARRDRHDRDRDVQDRREGLRAARAARPDVLARGGVGPRARLVARPAGDGRAAVQPVRAA